MISISGFCTRQAVVIRDAALMFTHDSIDYVLLVDTPIIGNGIFRVISNDEWDTFRTILKPTRVEEKQ